MKLNELLSICREMKGVTLREVEAATGLSNAFISQLETGKSEPSFRNVVTLCAFYGITLERLAKTLKQTCSHGYETLTLCPFCTKEE